MRGGVLSSLDAAGGGGRVGFTLGGGGVFLVCWTRGKRLRPTVWVSSLISLLFGGGEDDLLMGYRETFYTKDF
jgi:hypothetical protein